MFTKAYNCEYLYTKLTYNTVTKHRTTKIYTIRSKKQLTKYRIQLQN